MHWKTMQIKDDSLPRAARDLRSSNDEDWVSVTDCDNVAITLCTSCFTEFNSASGQRQHKY